MQDSLQEIRYMHWSLIKTVKSCADSAQFKFDVGLYEAMSIRPKHQ